MEKKNYIVAIDLGSSNVVVAVAERDAEGSPAVRSIVSKPSQGVKAGMITNIEQVSNSIKAAVEAVGEELGIRITEAYDKVRHGGFQCIDRAGNGGFRFLGGRSRNVHALLHDMDGFHHICIGGNVVLDAGYLLRIGK